MTQLLQFKATQDSVSSSPYGWKRGCSPSPAGLQAYGKGKVLSSPEVSVPPLFPTVSAARLAASSFLLFFRWCRWDLDRV